jgi:hypothetical protein
MRLPGPQLPGSLAQVLHSLCPARNNPGVRAGLSLTSTTLSFDGKNVEHYLQACIETKQENKQVNLA